MDKVVEWFEEKWKDIVILILVFMLAASVTFNIIFKMYDGHWREQYEIEHAKIEEMGI